MLYYIYLLRFVLTAAHCLSSVSRLEIIVILGKYRVSTKSPDICLLYFSILQKLQRSFFLYWEREKIFLSVLNTKRLLNFAWLLIYCGQIGENRYNISFPNISNSFVNVSATIYSSKAILYS